MNIIPLERWVRECHWPGCHAEPIEMEVPLCERHFVYIGERFMNERSVLSASYVFADRPTVAEKQAEARRRDNERSKLLEAQSVVYYVRIGDHVKIGFTTNLKLRLNALRVHDIENLLATEPGGRILEGERHKQFAAERVGRREDFNPSRRLLAHVDKVRADHGAPRITTYPRDG